MSLSQKGAAPILVLLAALGLLFFLLIASSASFKDKLFGGLFPKPQSKAVSDSTGAYFALNPPTATTNEGQQIPIAVTVRSDTHKANLFSAKINFDNTKLNVINIDTNTTFIKNWVEVRFDNTTGKISIIGAVPKPGFSTTGTDATMATIIFMAKAPPGTTISFDTTSAIYRNSDNVNFLVGTTGSDLIIQPLTSPSPTPTLTPSPSPSPFPSPTVSPSPSPSPSPGCALTSGIWDFSTNPVNEGVIVNLIINGSGSCDGRGVDVIVREDDGLLGFDAVVNNPAVAVFNTSNQASTSWVAEYQPDGFNGSADPPEYYFVANLVGDSLTIASSDPKLQVNKGVVTYKEGDGNRDSKVDLQDLSLLLSYWFDTTNFPDEIDINNDGVINTFDFSGMLGILGNAGIIQYP